MRAKAVASLVDRNFVGRAVTVAAMLGRRRREANCAVLAESKVWAMSRLVHAVTFILPARMTLSVSAWPAGRTVIARQTTRNRKRKDIPSLKMPGYPRFWPITLRSSIRERSGSVNAPTKKEHAHSDCFRHSFESCSVGSRSGSSASSRPTLVPRRHDRLRSAPK